MPFPREPSRPKDQTWVSCISCTGRWILYHSLPFLYWATWEVTDSHCSTIYNSQDIEATKVSINRWINKKIWCTYIHTVGFPSGSLVKNPRANAGDVGLILGSEEWEYFLEILVIEVVLYCHFIKVQRTKHCLFISTSSLNTFYVEKEMAAHSSVLAWETPWTKELGGL